MRPMRTLLQRLRAAFGGYFVPTQTQALRGYGPGGIPYGGSLDPFDFAPVARCVGLLSKDGARLIIKTLATVDEGGYRQVGPVKTARSRMLRKSVDGGRCSAYRFWKEVFSDLLCEGNAYIVPTYRAGALSGLRRMEASGTRWDPEDRVFWGSFADERGSGLAAQQRVTETEMVHCVFSAGRGWDGVVAPSPLAQIAQTVGAGLAADRRIREYFEKPGSDLAVQFGNPMSEDQETALARALQAYARKGVPLITSGNELQFGRVHDRTTEPAVAQFRSRLVKTVASIYGVPPAMLGEDASAVKVETLLREYWKGLGQVVDDLLEPLGHRLLPATNSFSVTPSYLVRGDFSSGVAAARAMFPNTGAPRLGFLREGRDLFLLGPITREEEAELRLGGAAPEAPEPSAPPEAPAEPSAPPEAPAEPSAPPPMPEGAAG